MKYPVYKPEITELEKKYVNDCLETTWISSKGKYIERFEKMVAEYIGSKYALSLHNGTEAIHIALIAAGIKPGDEVIVPDFTYIASANAVKYINATPILVDVSSETWNISVSEIKKAITEKTKAILVTDIYGTPPNMDSINNLAREFNLIVIEDAAESFGASYNGKMAGSLGHIGTFSFFGNKTITTGEGGMIVTDDFKIYDKARKLKNQGNSDNIRYYHEILGYNYRMTNIQAAIGCAQLERIDSIIQRKKEIFDYYKIRLSDLCQFQKIDSNIVSSNWMVSFLVNNSNRDNLMSFLNGYDIETRPFFIPIHEMSFYDNVDAPITTDISSRGINVPSYHLLKDEDLNYITNQIEKFMKNMVSN